MEDSSITAKYILDIELDYDVYRDYKNVSDISKLLDRKRVKDFNFGDIVSFGDYRSDGTKFIGKDNILIENPDYCDCGDLSIPYEITQHLDDATNKFKNITYRDIDLRIDDKLIIDKVGKIPKSWGLKLCLNENTNLFVTYPNKHQETFNINNVSAYRINQFYKGMSKEQTVVKLFYTVEGDDYDKYIEKYGRDNYDKMPKIPITWSFQHGSSGGGHKYHSKNYIFKGPLDEKDKVIKSIEKFYNGFEYKIS